MITKRNILKHEIIGLNVEVVESQNSSAVGLKGKIVDESMKTIMVETENGDKRLQKDGTVLKLDVGGKKILIPGKLLVARPEDRVQKKATKWK